MKPFRNVDVKRPPKITFAIGLCISLPGRSPLRASGISASALDRADHQDWIQTVERTADNAVVDAIAFFLLQVVVMADEQHSVSGGDTEQ